MKQQGNINIEYEARAMISEEQYLQIINYFVNDKSKRSFTNTNTYFDYEDLSLTKNHIVLRSREIDDSNFEITLKIKGDGGDIEIDDSLTSNELNDLKENCLIKSKVILQELNKLNIDIRRLIKVAKLKTERIEIQKEDCLIVIDKNHYNGKIDYNVEIESNSKDAAIERLNETFSPFGVTYKKGYISKSRRAIFKL